MSKKVLFRPALTVDVLRRRLAYNPETGDLLWLESPRVGIEIGQVAGSPNAQGYLQIMLSKRNYYAHRLVWLHQYGERPPELLDHINGNPADNRLANLRLADACLNQQNRKAASGVYRAGKAWRTEVRANGKRVRFGPYKTKEEAEAAYVNGKRELQPGFVEARYVSRPSD